MKTYEFSAEQRLDITIQEAWDFFSSPKNLSKITPPDLDFKIISDVDKVSIFNGMEITYTVKPIAGIPLKWKTMINNVIRYHQFTDIQINGPYALWEHTHTFVETKKGLLMTDTIKYQLPFGILGRLAHYLFVRKKIEDIFTYRKLVLIKLFDKDAAVVI